MNSTKQRIAMAFMALSLATWGCANPPVDQIQTAERAVADARAAEAGKYAAEDLAKLEGQLTLLKKELDTQNEKFSLLRDYGKAEQLAATLTAEAQKLVQTSTAKKQEAQEAAARAIQAAQEAISSAQSLVAKAPIGKDRAAFEAIKHDAEALSLSLQEAQKALEQGEYLDAQYRAKAISDKAQSVSDEIERALAKVKGTRTTKVATR
ncbi:MAG TPA: hypothetical protein VLA99_03935 [Nitrospiraceae bacterium]|nr:hypothetical protein [Nitrospiraceae bacterium]